MKKSTLVVAATLFVGGTAHAQSSIVVKYSNGNTLSIQNCTRVNPQRLVCSGTAINNQQDSGLYLNQYSFRLISPSGDEAQLSGSTLKGENAFQHGVTLRKGISYPIQLTFDNYTANTIKYFDAPDAQSESSRFENVRLSSSAPRATTPVPAPVTSGAAVNLGPGQVVLNGKAYTVTLTGCKVNTAGTYSCTGATATPLR